MFYSFGFFQHPLCRFLNVLKSLANSLISQSEDRMLGVIEDVLVSDVRRRPGLAAARPCA